MVRIKCVICDADGVLPAFTREGVGALGFRFVGNTDKVACSIEHQREALRNGEAGGPAYSLDASGRPHATLAGPTQVEADPSTFRHSPAFLKHQERMIQQARTRVSPVDREWSAAPAANSVTTLRCPCGACIEIRGQDVAAMLASHGWASLLRCSATCQIKYGRGDAPPPAPTVVVSHEQWQSRLAAERAARESYKRPPAPPAPAPRRGGRGPNEAA